MFCLADQLRHSTHGTIYAPASGFIKKHGNKSKNCGCEHNAIKTKSELGNAGMEQRTVISPVSWQLKCPQNGYDLRKFLCTGKYQEGIPEHLKEHDKKENQESIPKPFAFHPFRNILFAGKSEIAAQKAEKLASSAVAVTVSFCSLYYRDDQGDKETKKSQPGKQDIKKSQYQICQR